MNENPPPPALSATEWARYAESPHMVTAGFGIAVRHALQTVSLGRMGEDNATLSHGVMALANAALPDDDPRKVTPADVNACADAAMFDGPHPALARLALKLAALLPPAGRVSDATELPCEGGPWHGRAYALSPGMRGVRLADGEEGWLNVKGEEWLGWYEHVDDRLVWRGPAGMEPKEET